MKKTLKNYVFVIYMVSLILILLAKISNWFFDYSEETIDIIHTVMFCLIGIGYLGHSWRIEKVLLKLVMGLCGIFLIVMMFLPENNWALKIAIVCVLTPMMIMKTQPKQEKNMEIKTK